MNSQEDAQRFRQLQRNGSRWLAGEWPLSQKTRSRLTQAASIPFYQTVFDAVDIENLEEGRLLELPVLDRSVFASARPSAWRKRPEGESRTEFAVEYASTSGSSGSPLFIMRPAAWWIGEHARTYQAIPPLSHVKPGVTRRATLTTLGCSASICSLRDASLQARIVDNTLHLNTTPNPNDWTRTDVLRMLEEIEEFQPELLDADPVYLALLLTKADEHSLNFRRFWPKTIVLDFEFVTGWAKRFLESKIDATFVNLYGTTEFGCLIYSDDSASHVLSHDVIVELHDVPTVRRCWEIIVTSFRNPLMPLIRYRTGDLLWETGGGATTGDAGPGRFAVGGRISDVIVSAQRAGLSTMEIDCELSTIPADVIHYSIRTFGPFRIELEYVSATGRNLHPEISAQIEERLTDLLGPKVAVSTVLVPKISPKPTGKFPLAINEVD